MLWWALWQFQGQPLPLLMTTTSGPGGVFPGGIREYVRRWAHTLAAGHHWRGRAWDIGSLNGKVDRHTFVRLHLMRHVGHHEVWGAFAHHVHLISVLIYVR